MSIDTALYRVFLMSIDIQTNRTKNFNHHVPEILNNCNNNIGDNVY